MSLSFVRDVYSGGRAASSRSHPPFVATTVTTPLDGRAASSAWPMRITTTVDTSASAGWLGAGMPPIAAPHPRRPRLQSPVSVITPVMHVPGAAWLGAGCPTQPIRCSCHFGAGNDCDMLPGASRLYHTCDGKAVKG